ncbi:hypothetical protein, partial [Kocuria rosea]|uniref:hypothetical protein n=1 Tax=Kocuria rosea TaxID=1275 RepID=UPI001C9309DB
PSTSPTFPVSNLCTTTPSASSPLPTDALALARIHFLLNNIHLLHYHHPYLSFFLHIPVPPLFATASPRALGQRPL